MGATPQEPRPSYPSSTAPWTPSRTLEADTLESPDGITGVDPTALEGQDTETSSAAPVSADIPAGGAGHLPSTWRPRREGWAAWLPAASTLAVIGGVMGVVLWQMHLPLLLSSTSTAGGDTGAHYMMPAFFNTNLFPHLTGWDPYWYDGYPDYTFYFVLPDVLVAMASHVISYDVAFKLGTILGSLLLPVAAWALGRLFGLRPPIPAALAAATLPFLFDYSWTIYGGNLFSTLAGEYSYSLSIVFLLVFVGLFGRGIRTGRHRGWAAVVLALCVLAHVVPAVMAVVAAVILTAFELLPRRVALRDDTPLGPGPVRSSGSGRHAVRGRVATLWWAASTVGLGGLLAAWWIVPFLLRGGYATSMNYTKVTTYVSIFFPKADLWAVALAGVAVVVAVVRRSRFGLLFSVLGGASAVAVAVDPDRSLYNVRFLPLWFLCIYVMVGWVVGVGVAAGAAWVRGRRLASWESAAPAAEGQPLPPPRPARWLPGAVAGPLLAFAGAAAVVIPPFVPSLASDLPQLGIHPGANQVSVWATWNYTGYEGKADYPEYRGLMQLMGRIGATDGCGRAMWEYNADENRFGTPEALMLLPYWTTGCIDSEEGLLFESSATTPYHFLNQAELSVSPSEAVVGLPYGALTVPLGVEHLQLLGVRYFMAASPQVEREASADPTLRLLATSGPWNTTYDGQRLSTTWKVYEVKQSNVVEPLSAVPAVLTGVGQGQTTWLGRVGTGDTMTEGPSLRWYLDPSAWRVELTAGGPPSWPRISAAQATSAPDEALPRVRVSQVHQTADSISFHVSRTGVPVLVKISYFPNWHATGATGPWRATPNLMVVDPTSHDVTLTYGTTAVTRAGDLATVVGVAALAAMAGLWWFRRRARRRGPDLGRPERLR